MKKILIIAYDFPPYVSVGGLRPYSWYLDFHGFNLTPIVVTRQWDNIYGNHLDYIAASKSKETIIKKTEFGTIIQTPFKPNLANRIMLKYGNTKFKLVRKLITAYFEFAQFIFNVGTKSGLYFGAKKYIKNNDIDLIIATGSPHVLFKYASKLSKLNNIPWIADYRDPWTQSASRSKNIILKKWNSYFEKKYLKNASSIITVSDFLVHKISSLIKNKPIDVIMNGYNPDFSANAQKIEQEKKSLQFAFVGTIYQWHPIKGVLRQFNNFIDSNSDIKIKINFYGINKIDTIANLINSEFASLKQVIEIHPKTNNKELLNILAKHNLMLLFNDYCLNGTKIYDYLAIKRKILLCFSEEKGKEYSDFIYKFEKAPNVNFKIQEDIINATKSGIVIKNQKHMLLELNKLWEEFKKDGSIKCDSTDFEQYSRKSQTKLLSDIIKKQLDD